MNDARDLRPATAEEITEALSFALRFKGRRSFPQAGTLMAAITAAHLVEHLQRCGFYIMRGADMPAPNASDHDRQTDKP